NLSCFSPTVTHGREVAVTVQFGQALRAGRESAENNWRCVSRSAILPRYAFRRDPFEEGACGMPEPSQTWSYQLLTVEEAAQRLHMSRKALYSRISRGEGPPLLRMSRRSIRIDERDLAEWIESKREQPRTEPFEENRHRPNVQRILDEME